MSLNSFEMANNFSGIDGLIEFFYGDALSYFEGYPDQNLYLPPLSFEAQSYFQLSSSEAKSSFDDRCSTIEMQTNSSIDFDLHPPVAVIMPSTFLNEKQVQDLFLQLKVVPLTYEVYRMRPLEFTSQIYDIARRFLMVRGVFHSSRSHIQRTG